ncbi:glycoside hydrolase family 31 protein [Streptomyces chilikensis]|uniref:TIM-barrel domain-containing protein n=1 Tax=Streptomyces chilikensis TaxID=1194079 RepID=A0ABV3EK59_9ACTN
MTVRIDPFVTAEPEPGAGAGALRVTFASGRAVRVECSVPVDGVLRLRTDGLPGPGGRSGPDRDPEGPCSRATGAADPVLLDLPHRPARLARVAGGTEITGPGVRAVWESGRDGGGGSPGLRFGAFRRFCEPEGDTLPFTAGCLLDDGCPAGWAETVHLAPDSAVHGGGESYQGPNLRGRHRALRNVEENRAAGRDSAYLNVPLLWSDAGWGLFAHAGGPVRADLGATHAEAALVEIRSSALDLFLVSGDAPTVLARYRALTGRPYRPPEWVFGVWMCRSSYFTAEEMVRTADGLREAGCPVGLMHVDEWASEAVLETASWNTGADRDRFPAGWARPLHERGIRTSLWINPYVEQGTSLADDLVSRGFLLLGPDGRPVPTSGSPRTYLVDFLNARARQWWCERLARTLREEGASAVLADFGEEIPEEAVFADGSRGVDRRDTYGLFYQDTVVEAGRRVHGDAFVSVHRSGTAGSQRTAVHWAGDLPSTWTGLVSAVRALLSMSLSGFSVVAHDAGGYWTPDSFARAHELRRTMTPDAVPADVEPELYGRWAQWAAFSPVMRFHGMGRREPTAYPEPVRGAVLDACRLRPRLSGYLAEAAGEPLPLMRPMPLAVPGDRDARDADLQYLLGPDVLVAPVLEPGGERTFYVPSGVWLPLMGCPPLQGPGWRTVLCAADEFPAYVRAERGVDGVLTGAKS